MNIHSHQSLTESYISDYYNYVYKTLPPFQNRVSVDYYALRHSESAFDLNTVSFYSDINSDTHSGKYNFIHYFPILMATNAAVERDSNEKGIVSSQSQELQAIVDPLLNFKPMPGDYLGLNIDEALQIIYKITNVDESAMFKKPYYRISFSPMPRASKRSMTEYITNESVFIPSFHKIISRSAGESLIVLLQKIKAIIEKINSLYDTRIDFHYLDHTVGKNKVFVYLDHILRRMVNNEENIPYFSGIKVHTSYSTKHRDLIYPMDNILDWFVEPYLFDKKLINENIGFRELVGFNLIRENSCGLLNKYYDFSALEGLSGKETKILYALFTAYNELFLDFVNTSSDDAFDEIITKLEGYNKRDSNLLEIMDIWWKLLHDYEDILDNKFDALEKYLDRNIDSDNFLELLILFSQTLYVAKWCVNTKNSFLLDRLLI